MFHISFILKIFLTSDFVVVVIVVVYDLTKRFLFSLPQVQLLRIDQFGAMLVSQNNDYARQRAGELKPAMIINSPYYYGGVPRGTNVSVFEVKSTFTLKF